VHVFVVCLYLLSFLAGAATANLGLLLEHILAFNDHLLKLDSVLDAPVYLQDVFLESDNRKFGGDSFLDV